MCITTLAALLGLAAGCVVGAQPSRPDPSDSRTQTRWHPPPSPLRGLKRYEPVTAGADWETAPAPPTAMPSMPGMDMGGRR